MPGTSHLHGQRQRDRFLKAGGEARPHYEPLKLVLFQAQSKADVKPLATSLLNRFGSFAAVTNAEANDMREVEGIGDAGVPALKAAQEEAPRLYFRGAPPDAQVLSPRQTPSTKSRL